MSPTPSQHFSASYDTTAKIISTVVSVILIAAVIAVVIAIGNPLVIVLGAVVLLATYAWSPQSYSVAERTVLVHRLAGKARIPLNRIREARRATNDDLSGAIRVFGSGGAFGYYGIFRTSRLGQSTWYLTNRANAVLLTGDKTWLVSPDSPDRFLAAIQSSVPVSVNPAAAPLDAHQASRRPALAKVLIVALVLAAGAAFSSFALLYSPGPPPVTLTSNSLVIHDRFYPVTLSSSQVDVAHIRVIDLATDRHWDPVTRTNGFANAHYRSGHFRVAGGQVVRLYQAHAARLVLIPPLRDGTPVLLETPDPDAFAAELRREWWDPSHPPQA